MRYAQEMRTQVVQSHIHSMHLIYSVAFGLFISVRSSFFVSEDVRSSPLKLLRMMCHTLHPFRHLVEGFSKAAAGWEDPAKAAAGWEDPACGVVSSMPWSLVA